MGKIATEPGWKRLGWPVLLLGLAAFLFSDRLHQPSLWFDEGWSWHLARMPIPEMLTATAADRSPFLYYLGLHFWIRVAGDSEWALRWPSMAFGMLTLALLWRLATWGWGPLAGTLAIFPAMVSPFWFYYVQEARMYAMLAAGALAALGAMEAALRRPTPFRYALWTLLSAGVTLTHYYGLFPVAAMATALGGWGLASRTERAARLRRWGWSLIGLGILVGPWLVFARQRFLQPEAFLHPPTTIPGVLAGLAQGFWPRAALWIPALALALGALFGGGSLRWRWAAVTLGSLGLMLAALVFLFPRFALFHPRYAIFLWAFWTLGVGGGTAVGLQRSRVRGLSLLLWLSIGILSLGPWRALGQDPGRGRDPYREVVAHVARQMRPGEIALALRANWAVEYYWERLRVPFPLRMGPTEPLWDEEEVRRQLEEWQQESGPGEGPWRIWLIGWQQEVVDPLRLFDGLLLANGFEVGGQAFGSVWVAYYETWPPFRPRPLSPLQADFEGKIALRGFHLRPPRWPGDVLGVTVWWARVGEVPAAPRVFVHLLDDAGRLVAQQDGPLPNDLVPIDRWPPQHVYPVFTRIRVPPDRHGTYRVRVGLYDPSSGARWRVRGVAPPADGVVLGSVHLP